MVSLIYSLNLDKDPIAARLERARLADRADSADDRDGEDEDATGSKRGLPRIGFERRDPAKQFRPEETYLKGLVPVKLVRLVRRILHLEEEPAAASSTTSSTTSESDDVSSETNPEILITDPYARYVLADNVVKSLAKYIDLHDIGESSSYPTAVKEEIGDANRRLAFKVAGRVLATAVAASVIVAIPTVVQYHTIQVEKRKKAITELEKELDRASLEQLMQQYTVKFNGLIDRLKDFKGKYWIDAATTANFYLCYRQSTAGANTVMGTAPAPLERVSELSTCIWDLEKRLRDSAGKTPLREVIAGYLDNFDGLAKLGLQEIAEIRELEKKITGHYEAQIQRIKEFEAKTHYTLDDTRRNTLAARNAFEGIRDQLHLSFTAESSPVAFYGLVLSYLEYAGVIRERVPSGFKFDARAIGASSQADVTAAEIFMRYLAHESPTTLNTAPYWQPGGDFEKATALAGNVHRYLSAATTPSTAPAIDLSTTETGTLTGPATSATDTATTPVPRGGSINATGN